MTARDRGGDGGPRLTLYDEVAEQTASLVIRRYSTSFGMASRLLGVGIRQPVENIYALVRVADEIVDGVAEEAGLDRLQAGRLLTAYEAETERALDEGYSADLVVHAFARTARAAGFGAELTKPFFASMRADLARTEHDAESFAAYVYGSAEVVGLMCLRAVALAQRLFAELSRRLRRTPAEVLIRTRVRVPDPVKLRIALGAATLGVRQSGARS